jgi:uncharacterized protein YndB with AHSA1/START domain
MTAEIMTIRKAIIVEVGRQRAFDVFTRDQGTWWPSVYHIGAAPFETAVIEPFEGGRWFERGTDGTECDWGRVLAWEPPQRLVLSWQITPNWTFDPDLVTEIEVTFAAVGATRTRVDLEHRHLERFGEKAAEMFAIFSAGGVPGAPQGWAGMLAQYAARVATSNARAEEPSDKVQKIAGSGRSPF